ncbi:MAG: ATP-dependent Clp protease proteolytic subunit [Spirochaetes bacterium]|nr:ATP-dependent Clp protease proteolytic subunit [Spirochaetota bacterium]
MLEYTMNNNEKENDSFENFMEKQFVEQRKIIISGAINQKIAEKIIKLLFLLDGIDSEKPIVIIINSPGGDVFSGFAIFDIMRAIHAPVITLCAGFAASMGSIIMLGAKKGKRFATKNSKILIHQPLIAGVFEGRATDIEIQAEEIQETKERIINLYVKETGQSRDKVAKDIDADYWMTAEKAIEYGLIDKVVESMSDVK